MKPFLTLTFDIHYYVNSDLSSSNFLCIIITLYVALARLTPFR